MSDESGKAPDSPNHHFEFCAIDEIVDLAAESNGITLGDELRKPPQAITGHPQISVISLGFSRFKRHLRDPGTTHAS